MKAKPIIAAFLMAFCIFAFIVSANYYTRISNVGTVKVVNVGVYWDINHTNSVTSIDWGLLTPNSTTTKQAYFWNYGTTPINVTTYTENWMPSNARDCIYFVGWNGTLSINETRLIDFKLTIASDINNVTYFSFDVLVIGES